MTINIELGDEDKVGQNPYVNIAMLAMGVSQAELSRQTGIDATQLGRIQRGLTYSTPDNRQRIIGYFSAKYGKQISEDVLFPIALDPGKGGKEYRSRYPADEDLVSLHSAESYQAECNEVNGRSGRDNKQTDIEEKINLALDKLSPRYQRILRMRFGFDGRPYTLQELAEQENVTRERIRQIEKKAIARSRNSATFKVLKYL